jgi:hypothetical protein
MSFALTTPQFLARTKTVTRRLGWAYLKPWEVLGAIEKGQGLGKGGHVTHLGLFRIVSVRREQLDRITKAECAREGFPGMLPAQFVSMFMHANKCPRNIEVTRLEFEYLDEEPCPVLTAIEQILKEGSRP